MGKNLLIVIALLGLSVSAQASTVQATAVREVAPNSTQCAFQSIATSAADITGNTAVSSTTAGITKLELYPVSSTNTFCSHSSSVIVGTGTGDTGVPIPGLAALNPPTFPTAYGPTRFIINPTQKFFCIAAATAGLMVCKTR